MHCVRFVCLIILLVAFVVVNGSPPCHGEISALKRRNLGCAKHFLEIRGYVTKISEGEMTYDELSEKIANDCNRFNVTSCYNNLSTESAGTCNEDENIQNIRNSLKVLVMFGEFFCQNDGQKYLDFVKDDGAECYAKTEKNECYLAGGNAANVTPPTFKDENMCILSGVDLSCAHHYDDCTNQNVGAFFREFLLSAREKLNC